MTRRRAHAQLPQPVVPSVGEEPDEDNFVDAVDASEPSDSEVEYFSGTEGTAEEAAQSSQMPPAVSVKGKGAENNPKKRRSESPPPDSVDDVSGLLRGYPLVDLCMLIGHPTEASTGQSQATAGRADTFQ